MTPSKREVVHMHLQTHINNIWNMSILETFSQIYLPSSPLSCHIISPFPVHTRNQQAYAWMYTKGCSTSWKHKAHSNITFRILIIPLRLIGLDIHRFNLSLNHLYNRMNDCLSGEVNGKQYCLPAFWIFVFFLQLGRVTKMFVIDPCDCMRWYRGMPLYVFNVFLLCCICCNSVKLWSVWSLPFYCSLIHEHSAPNHICISAYQSNGYADVYVCVLCSVYNRVKHLMAVCGVSCSRGK